jgi:hypothetical protein
MLFLTGCLFKSLRNVFVLLRTEGKTYSEINYANQGLGIKKSAGKRTRNGLACFYREWPFQEIQARRA